LFGIGHLKSLRILESELEQRLDNSSKFKQTNQKGMLRGCQTPDGARAGALAHWEYGYSITVWPGGKPKVREFGHVMSPGQLGFATNNTVGMGSPAKTPKVKDKREHLNGVNTTDKEVKAVLEIPVVKKEDIRINAYVEAVEVTANNAHSNYHKTIE
jgi:HSP20 family molecular chaperone IbpA